MKHGDRQLLKGEREREGDRIEMQTFIIKGIERDRKGGGDMQTFIKEGEKEREREKESEKLKINIS